MEPEIPASSTQIGQDARGVIGQTVVGATVIYGSVTIIQGSQASASEHTASPAATDDTTTSAPTPAEEGHNPYQGLLAFQPSDGDRFFGRNAEIEDLWQRFRALHEQADATRLLVVYGPSGSGKSSLVRAGLVPELARRPPGGRAQARIALLVPGSQPLQALASVLARIATNDPAPVRKTREFAEELALSNGPGEHDGLQRIAALLPQADVWPLVVVVDQLEELYSLCPDAAVRQAFLANLLRAAADRSGQVAVLVTLRSDFLGATQADPALNQLIQAQGVFVAALSEQGLQDAIRLPAERRGRPLDAATVDLLVEQSLGRDGALPLLQFALLRIWEGLLRGQPAAATLRQIGGVGGALSEEADRILASLPEEDQRIARRLFLNLVQLGEGSRDTRRRVGLHEVIAHGEDPAATRRVIERFASPAVRLITRSSGQDGRETLELSHEALIEAWPLLRDWLNNSRADLRFQRRLEEAARHWENSGMPDGSLWRPPDLDLLERFRKSHDLDLTPLQLEFAEASRNAERERQFQQRRIQILLRWGLMAASGASVLAFGSTGFAWHQLRQARAAQVLQFEANHRALLISDPFVSLVYGLAVAEPLLDANRPWEEAELRASLSEAASANRSVAIPIDTGQGSVLSLIEMKNGELISGGSDGTLRRWRDGEPVGDGKLIATRQGDVSSLIELRNGELISGGEDGSLRRWRDGKPVGDGMPIATGQGRVLSLVELKNGELISSGTDGTLRRWRDGKPVGDGKPTASGQEVVLSLITLENGELISGGADGTLRRWRDGKPVGDGKPIATGQGSVFSLIGLKNGELISGGTDGTLRRWRDGKPVGDGKPIATGQGRLYHLIELKNGELISAGVNGTLRRWRDGKPVGDGKPIATGRGGALSLIELKNGELITGDVDGTLRRWRDGKPISDGKPIATRQERMLRLIELKNGELISSDVDGTLRRWRDGKPADDGNPIATGQGPVYSLIELTNGELISGGSDGTLRRWRDGKPVGDGKPIATGQEGVYSLIELKNGELISGGVGGTLRRWRDGKPVGDGKPIATGQLTVLSLIELKNGELIIGGSEGTLQRWRDGKPLGDGKQIATGQGGVLSLLELKNGELISGGRDGTLRRWRDGKPVGDGKPIATGQEGVWSLLELKNGELISSGEDGSLRRWSIKPAVIAICRSIDLSSGSYPAAMESAREAARSSCRKVGVVN
jgi:WD40 repeat protein